MDFFPDFQDLPLSYEGNSYKPGRVKTITNFLQELLKVPADHMFSIYDSHKELLR